MDRIGEIVILRKREYELKSCEVFTHFHSDIRKGFKSFCVAISDVSSYGGMVSQCLKPEVRNALDIISFLGSSFV
jgi:hypothetical protein